MNGALVVFGSLRRFGTLSIHGSLTFHGALNANGSLAFDGTLRSAGSLSTCGALSKQWLRSLVLVLSSGMALSSTSQFVLGTQLRQRPFQSSPGRQRVGRIITHLFAELVKERFGVSSAIELDNHVAVISSSRTGLCHRCLHRMNGPSISDRPSPNSRNSSKAA